MKHPRKDFQIFVKPAGARCNLRCHYCYYLDKAEMFAAVAAPIMPEQLLARYIEHHLLAYPGKTVHFSWHGGEPTLLGLDYFRHIVELQHRYCPRGKGVANGIQTNGTLIDEDWAAFFAAHRFTVGLSLDGPQPLHDRYRQSPAGEGCFQRVMRGYHLLQQQGVAVEVLCVLNDDNVMYPLQVYRFFKDIGVRALSFLPLVEVLPEGGASPRSVPPEAFGAFLCTVFDEWRDKDIGTIMVQIFEEALRTAFGREHSLCLFRPTCGEIPVLEQNGDLYPCDHFVEAERCLGNLAETSLSELLRSRRLLAFGKAKRSTLPGVCRQCPVYDMCGGECPKNRIVDLPGETVKGNYLCAGYKLFFSHCRPLVKEVARQWQRERTTSAKATAISRNQPCPCDSGRKYKNCCGRKGLSL